MAKTKPSWPEVTGPLAEYAAGFRAELARLGYTPLSAAGQLRLMAHLSRWMTAEGLDARTLGMPAVERYFEGRRSAGYVNERTVEALGPLLASCAGSGRLRSRRRHLRRRPGSCWTGMRATWLPSGAWHRARSR